MSLKNIVYDDIVNLENCESEPIHIPGSIQPHGYLFALDSSKLIRFCSENIREIGHEPAQVLGQPFQQLFEEKEGDKINKLLVDPDYTKGDIIQLNLAGQTMNTLAHKSGDYFIIELEPYASKEEEIPFLNSLSFEFARLTGEAENLKELCQKSVSISKP